MPRTVLRLGTWNVKRGRDVGRVAAEVAALLAQQNLDALTLQEAADYSRHASFRLAVEEAGYRVHTGRGLRSRRDSAVVVAAGLPQRRRRVHSLGGLRWERRHGRPGLHPARHMVSVEVDGCRIAAPHLPPTPHAKRQPLRGRAHRAAVRRCATIFARWSSRGRAWVAFGDWNIEPRDGLTVPLRRVGNADGDRIDWLLSSPDDVVVVGSPRRMHGFGDSDHAPVVATIRTH